VTGAELAVEVEQAETVARGPKFELKEGGHLWLGVSINHDEVQIWPLRGACSRWWPFANLLDVDLRPEKCERRNLLGQSSAMRGHTALSVGSTLRAPELRVESLLG